MEYSQGGCEERTVRGVVVYAGQHNCGREHPGSFTISGYRLSDESHRCDGACECALHAFVVCVMLINLQRQHRSDFGNVVDNLLQHLNALCATVLCIRDVVLSVIEDSTSSFTIHFKEINRFVLNHALTHTKSYMKGWLLRC
jgi:hypothetical protein